MDAFKSFTCSKPDGIKRDDHESRRVKPHYRFGVSENGRQTSYLSK